MKSFLSFAILAVLTISQSALSYENGGGVIVGNGAGIVESNFQYAYQSLKNVINHCLHSNNCNVQKDEHAVLLKLIIILETNANNKERLIFLSEKLNPGFFMTGEAESNRIAKTFLNPESPIFINIDQLYNAAGRPTLNFQRIIALLIHELGHQSGVLDHAWLDILGAKVADYSENSTNHFSFRIDDEDLSKNQSLIFSVTNLEFPIKSSILIFNWRNTQSINLSNTLAASSSCQYESESFQGTEISNGHFSFDEHNNLRFLAWVKVHCYESFSSNNFIYKRNLSVTLDSDYKILSLIVE